MDAITDLERFRRLLGISVSEMARQTGVERSRLAHILSGKARHPRIDAYLPITTWARIVARHRRIPVKDRLQWEAA